MTQERTYGSKLSELFGTQARAAKAAGVGQSSVQRWGSAVPAERCLLLIKNAPDYGVDPRSVFATLRPIFSEPLDALAKAADVASDRYDATSGAEAA